MKEFLCFVFQFGKGVLEMARVFDRQVGMLLLPLRLFCSIKKKNLNSTLGLHAPVFVYLECPLPIRRKEKKANAEEVIYSLTRDLLHFPLKAQ